MVLHIIENHSAWRDVVSLLTQSTACDIIKVYQNIEGVLFVSESVICLYEMKTKAVDIIKTAGHIPVTELHEKLVVHYGQDIDYKFIGDLDAYFPHEVAKYKISPRRSEYKYIGSELQSVPNDLVLKNTIAGSLDSIHSNLESIERSAIGYSKTAQGLIFAEILHARQSIEKIRKYAEHNALN